MALNKDVNLLAVFKTLSESDQASVLSYAEFLASRQPGVAIDFDSASTQVITSENLNSQEPIPEPDLIPRPEQESVIQAVKRLSASYSMLNKKTMLGVTSDMMMKHIVHGEDADQVIDELEVVFKDAYSQLLEQGE